MRLLSLLCLTLIFNLSQAQTPYSFDADWSFETQTAVGTIDVATATTQNAAFGSGLTDFFYVTSNGSLYAYESHTGWTTAASLDLADYIEVCVNTNTGTKFVANSVVALSFDEATNNSGPRSFAIRASVDNFSTFTTVGSGTIPDNTNWRSNGPYNYTVPSEATAVCFRIYGYNTENTNSGTWTFDNIGLAGNSALPVKLLYFNVKPAGNDALLEWSTAEEKNNALFVVERSGSGQHFESIGSVNGSGSSDTPLHYTFTDEEPISGTNYYRLRQVDTDGAGTYSPIASVSFEKKSDIRLSPVPANNSLRVAFGSPATTAGNWQVFDQTGRLVLQGAFESGNDTLELPVAPLSAGTYTLKVATRSGAVVKKFEKSAD